MDAPLNQIFFPSSFHELFSVWNRFPAAVLFAGGTDITWRQGKGVLDLPPVILCLDKLTELHRITRTEHYLEIGAMVKLNKLIWLGKVVPQALCDCLENIWGVQLRNIATIGGNICCPSRLLDASAPLSALDAQYELRTAHGLRWVAASRFHAPGENPTLEKQEILTRIRLPIHKWDYSMYKKFYSEDIYNSKVFVFLAKTQKNMLSDIRVVYKEHTLIRNKSAEGVLAGKSLPINHKSAEDFVNNWREFLSNNSEISEFTRNKLINCIENNLVNLSE